MAKQWMKTKTSEGYIVQLINFKENDHIIKVITNDELLSLRVRGSQKLVSKNSVSNLLFAKVKFIYTQPNEGLGMLRSREVLKMYPQITFDLIKSSLAQEALKIISRLSHIEAYHELYQLLDELLANLASSANNQLNYANFLIGILKLEGLNPQVDACLKCGNTQKINSFNIYEGGFGCLDCNLSNYHKEELLTIRQLFKQTYQSDNDLDTKYFKIVIEYYNYHMHYDSEILNMLSVL